jgi:hypothetical protein
MKKINIEDKLKYFNERKIFDSIDYDDVVKCIHCEEIVHVKDYNVYEFDGVELIMCPNSPRCDGSLIDFFPLKKKNIKSNEADLWDEF